MIITSKIKPLSPLLPILSCKNTRKGTMGIRNIFKSEKKHTLFDKNDKSRSSSFLIDNSYCTKKFFWNNTNQN